MIAMQYEISLPADYDMEIVRERVRTRGHALDALSGLAFKAYLARRRANGEGRNEYAPLYLWRDAAAMTAFLSSSGFRGLSGDFGRPSVRQWLAIGLIAGPELAQAPVVATRSRRAFERDGDAGRAIAASLDDARSKAARCGAHSALALLDTASWEATWFTLWVDEPPACHLEQRYNILHLSRPELAQAIERDHVF